jgi:hypothetical protein
MIYRLFKAIFHIKQNVRRDKVLELLEACAKSNAKDELGLASIKAIKAYLNCLVS